MAQQPAPADPTKTENVSRDGVKPAEMPVKQMQLSNALAQYGRVNKDPLSLIVAAQMRKGFDFKVVDRKPDGDASPATQGDTGPTVEGLLKEARELSKNDKTIVALADDVMASASKGRVGGGQITLGAISARTTHTYTMSFAGGRFAEVAAIGINTNNIILEIEDQGGHRICRDSDPAYCPFNPIWTGPFRVKVINTGGSGAVYRMETN